VYNDNLGIYEKRHNEEMYDLYEKLNVLTYIRCKCLEWLGHVCRADGDVLKNVLIRKIDKKRPLGRPRTGWKDTVKKDMRLIDELIEEVFNLTFLNVFILHFYKIDF
jgi:hypothetical protein